MRPLQLGLQLGLVVLALTLGGCPQPTPGKSTPAQPGATPAGSDTTPGGEPGATPGATPTEGGGDTTPAAPAWSTIPEDLLQDEHFYPQLKPTANWPDPISLTPIAKAPEGKRPEASKIRILKELVEFCVHPDLVPKDLDAALGLDEQGRLFVKLGQGKTSGSASMDTTVAGSKFPVFAMTLKAPTKGPHTLESLGKRVAKVVKPGLMDEINKTKESRFAASPRVKGDARVAAMALLDPAGAFGTQFPYVYAYGGDDHLVVLFQEVPHMSGGEGPR